MAPSSARRGAARSFEWETRSSTWQARRQPPMHWPEPRPASLLARKGVRLHPIWRRGLAVDGRARSSITGMVGRLGRGCPRLRLGPQGARAAPPPASCLELFRRGRAALRQAAAALPHTWCACRAACRQRVPVKHAADRRLRGRKVIGLPARARRKERRATPWPVRSRA